MICLFKIQLKGADVSCRLGNTLQDSTATSVASESFSSTHLLPPDVIDQSLVVVGPKNHKTAASYLLPWYKELVKVSQKASDNKVVGINSTLSDYLFYYRLLIIIK